MSFAARQAQYNQRLERALNRWLPSATQEPRRLHEAMRYACLSGGKRLRPQLIYAAGEVLKVPAERLDGVAAAVEMVHCYSLIHDDLPAMDDDDLRRGQPTCHKAFDEATAILAGDALQALAFEVLLRDDSLRVDPAVRLHILRLLAEASGSLGMAGGQAFDLAAIGKNLSQVELENMHIHKTGALIRAGILMTCAVASPLPAGDLQALDRYAKRVGLAFQVHDDILDEIADSTTLGKTNGKDRAANKPTFPSLLGLAKAQHYAKDLANEALAELIRFDDRGEPLQFLANEIVSRSR